jgi:hypothetical protein
VVMALVVLRLLLLFRGLLLLRSALPLLLPHLAVFGLLLLLLPAVVVLLLLLLYRGLLLLRPRPSLLFFTVSLSSVFCCSDRPSLLFFTVSLSSVFCCSLVLGAQRGGMQGERQEVGSRAGVRCSGAS